MSGGGGVSESGNSSLSMMSPTQDRPNHEQLTSFGFLNEADEEQESVFALGSLLSRVRNAFVPGEQAAPSDSGRSSLVTSPDTSFDGQGAINSHSRVPASSTATDAAPLINHQRKSSGKVVPGGVLRAQVADGSVNAGPSAQSTVFKKSEQAAPTRKNSKASSIQKSTASSRSSKLPYALASSSFAPAITSTAAAHAIVPQRLQSFTPDDVNDDEDDGEDVLSALMRKSGVDQSRRKAAGFSSIPGFPLSKDTLADDTRSIHSSSSRMPRSETHSTSEAHFISAHSHAHGGHVSTSSGLGASADAFRRMRGEGTVLSRDLWMPDESVKECRECQSYFTPFRRKHHCRICGLVYCSRCASNIVSGSRFGLDRAEIRVCNYCLRVLSEYERAGRRSDRGAVLSSSPSAAIPSPHRVATSYARKRTESNGLGAKPDKAMISGPLEAQLQSPQSQFAANQLFSHPRGAAGSSLSVAQGLPRLDSLQDMLLELEEDTRSRPHSPSMGLLDNKPLTNGSDGVHQDEQEDHVPFRVKLSEEDRIPAAEDEMPRLASPEEDISLTKSFDMAASKKIKPTSEEAGPSKTIRLRDNRSKLLGDSSFLDARERGVTEAALRALRRSKLRVRDNGEDFHSVGPRTALLPKAAISRKASYASTLASRSDELNSISVQHFSALLQQVLERNHVTDVEEWQSVLEPLLHTVVRHIHPRPRLGESLDVRQYVKFKRIPGGSISESIYVDGFVLSKQVATKKMARSLPLSNPRVMVVAFPIDFNSADEQFMSLQPVLAQEHEYTRILVARLLQLRPNVLVVQGSVSRLALHMLEEAGVVVVWSLKTSAVQAISRCCQADIISSVERLALEPRLGRCASFSVETYQHAASPQCRKSLMRFHTAGHARSLGSSIVLRGASLDKLGVIKSICSLLVYAAHNLRLEEQLNRDEGAQMQIERTPHERHGSTSLCPGPCDLNHDELWQRILDALKPFENSILSVSASINISPPYQLVKMKETHRRLRCLQQDCSGEVENEIVVSKSNNGTAEDSNIDRAQDVGNENTANGSGSDEKEGHPTCELTLEDVMPKPSQVQAEYSKALMDHQLFFKEWSACVKTDTSASLRKISILWTLISTATHKPCMGPRLLSYTFYGPQDEALGQFLERTCTESSTLCPAKGCGRPRGVHYSSFVHNDTRVQVVLERFVCPIPGQESRLLMWSYCKRCERATPVTPVSDDTWSLSFAKYLELHFYDGQKTTTLCGHDYYADFVRFFSLQNLAIRFHRDRDLVVRDVVLPPMRLLPRPDVDYRLKLESAKNLQERMDAYWSSVKERMNALRKEPSLSVQHVSQLENAMMSAKGDELQLKALLIDTCRSSDQTDVLALNAVRNRLQSFVVRWDQFFQEFERAALPSERDMRRLTSHHLSRMFQEKGENGPPGSERVVDALGLSPAVEEDEMATTSGLDAALSASATSEERKPSISQTSSATRAPGDGKAAGDTAEPEVQPSRISGLPPSSPMFNSPAAWRRLRAATQSQETSPVEATSMSKELPDVQSSGVSDNDAFSARPALRRGKTTEEVRKTKAPDERGDSSTIRNSLLPRAQQPSVGPASPSARRNTGPPRRGPPSSYRPPKSLKGAVPSGMDTESDGGALSSGTGSSIARRKMSMSQRRGRIEALDAAKESTGPVKDATRPASRVPVSTTNRSSRVSTIARRFDNLQREAEREGERQRLVRARRARPVGASQATVQVYRSVRDAVRDDDDESELSGLESQGDEAEDEAESEGDERRQATEKHRARRRAQQNSSEATIRATDTLKATIDGVNSSIESASKRADENDHLAVPSKALEGESSPERELQSIASSASEACRSTITNVGQGPEAAGMELTVSSLLSGTLPASWRASLLPLESDSSEGRGSLLKTITSLWARGTLNLPMIELPIRGTEHLFSDSPLVVLREEEPSSLIAFTLSSSTYASRLESLRKAHAPVVETPMDQTTDSWRLVDSSQKSSIELRTSDSIESALRQAEGTHLSFQFSSGDSRFSIRVLFTEQFEALRQACDCGQTFVQSLSRCWNWSNCTGGKSGAAMMKTLDDRFIVKQLSRAEMDAFASNAGAYFRFLADVLYQDRPTTLAKIYGVYRLTIRNAQTGKSIKLDCAITENVFANAKMAQIFDLKGALRNRFVQPNGQVDQVLLDGNLITSKVPIYLREGSKRILRQALFHDSLFLASCDVMDYSLVVGVCEGTPELRVGIIDFIRTFTFGKKAESFLKEAVGGHGSEAPTIIDPKQYRARFLAFLDSVLLLSPDHWLSEEDEQASSAEMQGTAGLSSGTSAGNIANQNSVVAALASAAPSIVML